MDYKEISAKKIAQREAKLPAEWKLKTIPKLDNVKDVPRTSGLLTERELEITENYDAVDLLPKIHSGHFSAEEVTIAFCKRTTIAQQLLNCVTEIMFDDAIARAKELDAYLKTHGKPIGPLHGLPISLKDSMNVKGVESVIGMTAYAFKPEEENSGITDALLLAGAILFVKTAVPQSMMVLDTENFTFGRARNPHSEFITAAGSSGGAGALVAFRGSLIGIATDIGGSIRVPAYCNGIYGIRPSSGRMPYYNVKGYWPAGEEYNGVLCVEGPVATTMRDCELLVRSVAQTEPWTFDPTCAYLPWDATLPLEDRPLSIGVFNFGNLEPISSILSEAIDKLKAAGHDVIDIDFPFISQLADNALDFFKVDGGKFLVGLCNTTNEPLTEAVQNGGMYPCEPATLDQFFKYTYDRVNMQKKWLDHWASTAKLTKSGKPVDVFFMSTLGALPRYREPMNGNEFVYPWNTLDYPAMNFPATTFDPSKHKIEFPPATTPYVQKMYDDTPKDLASIYKDFPIGLQLVGRHQNEPALFAAFNKIAPVFGAK